MSLSAESKSQCLALLFAWPAAVGAGGCVGELTHTHWPIAAFAMVWLGVLFRTLRRATRTVGDYASRSR